jgi:hypothetical protein
MGNIRRCAAKALAGLGPAFESAAPPDVVEVIDSFACPWHKGDRPPSDGVEASAKGYKEVGSFKAPKRHGPAWAHPVVLGGRLYLREGDALYCYDVSEKP